MTKLFFVSIILLAFAPSFAHIGPQGFGLFLNHKIFVETGTYHGEGILRALEAGFTDIKSIEFDADLSTYCQKRLAEHPLAQGKKVQIFQGNSLTGLWDIIKDIKEPITFWLDAHTFGTTKNCPLLEELDQIKRHPIKNHIILIDDMRECGTIYFDFLTKKNLIDKVLEINPNYQIFYIEGYIKNDIMVAIAAE